MKKPLGIILYKGKSEIDGKQIIVIATGISGKTDNQKTGDMIQTWIMRLDVFPTLAAKLGYDYSVCGDCKHKHFGSCYVNLGHGPNNVMETYHRGGYVEFEESHLELFKNRMLRLGSYGDPASVLIEIWDKLCSVSDGWTGYTHQWNTRFIDPKLKDYCMASCDNATEYSKAKSMGWRCFRIRMSDDFSVPVNRLNYNEFVCPASDEAGNKTSCSKCKACMGLSASTLKDPVIIIHGVDFKIVKFKWGMERIAWKEKYRKFFMYPIKKKKRRRKKRIVSRAIKI